MKSKFLWVMMALVSMTAFTSCHDDDDDSGKTASVPKAYTEALTAKYPAATNVVWEKKDAYMVAEFKQNNDMEDLDVWFDATATWAMTDTDYGKNVFFLPAAVNAAWAQGQYGNWTVDEIDFYQRPDIEFYVLEVEKTGQPDTDLYYLPDGTQIKAVASDATSDITPTTVVVTPTVQ